MHAELTFPTIAIWTDLGRALRRLSKMPATGGSAKGAYAKVIAAFSARVDALQPPRGPRSSDQGRADWGRIADRLRTYDPASYVDACATARKIVDGGNITRLLTAFSAAAALRPVPSWVQIPSEFPGIMQWVLAGDPRIEKSRDAKVTVEVAAVRQADAARAAIGDTDAALASWAELGRALLAADPATFLRERQQVATAVEAARAVPPNALDKMLASARAAAEQPAAAVGDDVVAWFIDATATTPGSQ